MITKKNKRRKVNILEDGSWMKENSKDAWNNAWQPNNVGNSIGGVTSGITGIVEAATANAKVKDITPELQQIEDITSANYSEGNLDVIEEQFKNQDFGRTDYNWRELRGLSRGEIASNYFKGITQGAQAGSQIGGAYGAIAGAVIGGVGAGIGDAYGKSEAKYNADYLNAATTVARNNNLNNLYSSIQDTKDMTFKNLFINKNAYGGKLKHTGNFSNDVVFINNGGLHSQNPFGGVLVGVDNEGTPNLVEEGEIIYNDYVYSNRLKPSEKSLGEVGFNKKYKDWTFAKIAEDLQLASAEMPNDAIEKRGLEANMFKLMTLQEQVRAKKNKDNQPVFMAAYGGQLGNIFAGVGNKSNFLPYNNTNGFKYYNDGKYDENYLNWLNGLSLENNNALLKSLNDYYNKTMGTNLALDNNFLATTKALGQDKKFGEFHKLLGDAYELSSSAPDIPELSLNIEVEDSDIPIEDNVIDQTLLNEPFDANLPDDVKKSLKDAAYKSKDDKDKSYLGRYAPVFTNAATLLHNIFSKPDYSNAERVEAAARAIPGGSYTLLGDYVRLDNLDRNYYLNQLLNTGRSNARAIQNQGLNSGQAIAGLLANNYNTQRNIGNTLIQMEQENMNRDLQEAQFNRGTNQANSEMGLRALAMDQQRGNSILGATQFGSQMRENIDALRSQAISSSLSGLSEDISGIGTENYWKNVVDNAPWLLYDTTGKYKGATANYGKNGGLLTKKKRRNGK